MSQIGKLSVVLEANTTQWNSKLKEAEKATEGFKDKVSKSLNSVGDAADLISPAAGSAVASLTRLAAVGGPVAIAITAVGAALTAATGYASKMAEAFDDLQDQTQLSTEYLSKLEYAARLNGSSLEESANMVTKMQRSLFEAKSGSVDMAIAMSKLGIDIDTAMQDGTGGVQTLAQAFAAMPDGMDKVRLMMDILGKSGAKVNGALNDIADSAGKSTDRTDEAQKIMKEFERNMNELYITAGKAVESVGIPVANAINSIIKSLRQGANEAEPLWRIILNKGVDAVANVTTGKGIRDAVLPQFVKNADTDPRTSFLYDSDSYKKTGKPTTFGVYQPNWADRNSTGVIGQKKEVQEQTKEVTALSESQQRAANRTAVFKAGLADLNKQFSDGKLSAAQYNQKVKEFKENFDKVEIKGGSKSSTKKDDQSLKNYTQFQEDLNKVIVKSVTSTDNLTESEKKLNDLQASEKWAGFTQAQRDNITARVESVSAVERQQKATEAYTKVMKEVAAAEKQAQFDTLDLSDAQQKLLAIQQSPEWATYTIAQRQQIIATYDAKDASDELRKTQARLKELLTDSGLDKAREDMKLLSDALRAGEITEENYLDAVSRRLDLKGPVDDSKEAIINLSSAMDNASRKMTQSFIDFAATGKASFADLAKSILANIAEMILQQMIFNSLKSGATSMAASSTGWISSLGNMFLGTSSGATSSATDAAAVVASANGNIFSGGRLMPFATGGLISQPTYFPMANGGTGVAGEAGIEGIFPITRINGKLGIAATGAGNTSIDNRKYQVSVTVQGGQTNEQTGNIVAEKVMRSIAQQEIMNQQRRGGSLNPMNIR